MLLQALKKPGFIVLSFAHLLSPYMMINSEKRKMKYNFQRHPHVTSRFGLAETSFSEKALTTSKNKPKYLHQPSRDSYVSVIPITHFEREYLSLRFLFRSIMLRENYSRQAFVRIEMQNAPSSVIIVWGFTTSRQSCDVYSG